jgi:hypothetical protein
LLLAICWCRGLVRACQGLYCSIAYVFACSTRFTHKRSALMHAYQSWQSYRILDTPTQGNLASSQPDHSSAFLLHPLWDQSHGDAFTLSVSPLCNSAQAIRQPAPPRSPHVIGRGSPRSGRAAPASIHHHVTQISTAAGAAAGQPHAAGGTCLCFCSGPGGCASPPAFIRDEVQREQIP